MGSWGMSTIWKLWIYSAHVVIQFGLLLRDYQVISCIILFLPPSQSRDSPDSTEHVRRWPQVLDAGHGREGACESANPTLSTLSSSLTLPLGLSSQNKAICCLCLYVKSHGGFFMLSPSVTVSLTFLITINGLKGSICNKSKCVSGFFLFFFASPGWTLSWKDLLQRKRK